MTTDDYLAATERAHAVTEALRDGRISLDSVPKWLLQLKEDPSKAAILASLAPGLLPNSAPHSGNPIRSALNTGTVPPPQPVERPTRDVAIGGGLINMQAQLIGGKPHSEWTYEEGRDAALWALGPRFRQGLKPPPEPQWFIPGESVQHQGEWK